MQRSLMHAGAWTLATGAAVTLSWFGVHTVLRETAYDPPRAVPVSAVSSEATPDGPAPQASSTHRPRPSPTPSAPDAPSGVAPSSGTPTDERSTGRTPSNRRPSPAPARERVESRTMAGGRVVFDLSEHSASLVSATPHSGWNMQVWKADAWIRVTFTSEDRASTVFCTWNGHPPEVQAYEE